MLGTEYTNASQSYAFHFSKHFNPLWKCCILFYKAHSFSKFKNHFKNKTMERSSALDSFERRWVSVTESEWSNCTLSRLMKHWTHLLRNNNLWTTIVYIGEATKCKIKLPDYGNEKHTVLALPGSWQLALYSVYLTHVCLTAFWNCVAAHYTWFQFPM